MTVDGESARLRAENKQLRVELAIAQQVIAELRQQVGELRQEVAEFEAWVDLEQQHTKPKAEGSQRELPAGLKANRPKSASPKQPRKKRSKEHNHARRRDTPTRTERHALDCCPECSYRLQGETVDYVRQVLELPEPRPVEVTEHQVVKRFCPHCERWRSPKLDLTGQVLGQSRIGVGLVSLVCYLRDVLRLPIRAVRGYLETLHRVRLSVGEIVELLHRTREQFSEAVAGLKRAIQESEQLHADETGWRENGQNGYIWAFATPGSGEQAIRYYEFDHSRAQAVVRRVLGNRFKGVLVSDFYVGYNDYGCEKQRCWTHLLRDLHELKVQHDKDSEAQEWAQAVRALYDEAKEWLGRSVGPTQQAREAKYVELMGQIRTLGLKYARVEHPCQGLAKRLLRHEDELFRFVLVEGLSANNNLAERSIRPLVVVRKISGGTRSEAGSKTRMALASLFGTWQARGLNPLEECLKLLRRRPTSEPAPA